MHKEVTDIINVCNTIASNTQKINEVSEALKELVNDIEQKTEQVDVPTKSLAMRKPLAALFILNSNLDDILKNFEKIYDDINKI